MKLSNSKKILGSLILCGLSSEKKLQARENSVMESLNSWGIEKINLDGMLNNVSDIPKKDVIVAVIDSGVSTKVPQLSDKLLPGYNFIDSSSNISDRESKHGTYVAEIINMVSKDSYILPLKVSDDNTKTSSASLTAAIDYAVDNGANIINLSIGAKSYGLSEFFAIERAIENNCIVVASSGNDNSTEVSYPAAFEGVVAVGAIDKENNRYSFSNIGPELDIMAPGMMESPSDEKNMERGSRHYGTSFSVPYVTGVMALLWQYAPEMSGKEITDIVFSSARWLGNFNETEYGNGLIDVCKSYEKILSIQQNKTLNLDCDNYWYSTGKDSSSYKVLFGIGIGAVAITALGATLCLTRNKNKCKNIAVTIEDETERYVAGKDITEKDITEIVLVNINNKESNKEIREKQDLEI